MAYLQVSPLGGSHVETWHGQGIRKHSVSWNLPKLSQLWWCNRFWTMYRTEPPMDKTIHEWYMKFQQSDCLCVVKWPGQPGPLAETVEHMREMFVRSPQKSPRVDISNTCKVGQKLGVSLPLLTCSPSGWSTWLLYRRGRKSQRDLWITLYFCKTFILLLNHLFFNILGSFYPPTVSFFFSCSSEMHIYSIITSLIWLP
jgi:hypothetical protein